MGETTGRPSQLDGGLSRFSYDALLMLTVFAKHESFQEVGKSLGVKDHVVRGKLQPLAEAIEARTGTKVMLQVNARRWVMTEAGKRLAEQADGIVRKMQAAMQSIDGGQLVNVVTTSNCCGYMAELKHRVEDEVARSGEDPIRVRPLLKRSSEISLATLPEDTELALFSKLFDINDTNIEIGREIPVNGGWMIPLEIQNIAILTTGPLTGSLINEPTPAGLIEAGFTLCVPAGGVAWEILQADAADWHMLKYRQYFDVTDLYGGIKVLETGIAGPRAAMIVHGLEVDDPRLKNLDDSVLSDLYDSTGRRSWRAVTGFFRADPKDSADQHGHQWRDHVWKQAQALWATQTTSENS